MLDGEGKVAVPSHFFSGKLTFPFRNAPETGREREGEGKVGREKRKVKKGNYKHLFLNRIITLTTQVPVKPKLSSGTLCNNRVP